MTCINDKSRGDYFVVYKDDIRNRSDVIDTYIARSTNSIDCKPYYDCFKSYKPDEGTSSFKEADKDVTIDLIDRKCVIEDRHSDTYADYRPGGNEIREKFTSSDDNNLFKFKFNRSLNGCQIKNKRKVNTMY